jgi:hypothetical protein
MGFKNKTKILFLIPNMDTTIGASRVTDTILVENGTIEFGLFIFGVTKDSWLK